MKKLILLFSALFILPLSSLFAGPLLDFGLKAGLAIPNDRISNVFNKEQLKTQDFIGNLKTEALDNGYNVAARLRLDLVSNLKFMGEIGFNRFPQTEIEVIDPSTNELIATLNTTINIIPITAGINWYLIEKGVGIYLIGDLKYNYISSSLDTKIDNNDVTIPVQSSEAENTIGYGIGAGVDFSLVLLRANIEAEYNHVNLISSKNNDDMKTYATVTLGIYF